MPIRAAGAAALATLALAACGSQDSPSTSTTPSASTPAPSSPAPTGPIGRRSTIPAGQKTGFAAPGGDVLCSLSADGARCDVGDHTYAPPPKPSTCTDSWGEGFALTATRAEPVCAKDTVYDGDTAEPAWFVQGVDSVAPRGLRTLYTLGAGHTLVAGDITCGTDAAGVATCRTSDGKHGFLVSKAAYRTW